MTEIPEDAGIRSHVALRYAEFIEAARQLAEIIGHPADTPRGRGIMTFLRFSLSLPSLGPELSALRDRLLAKDLAAWRGLDEISSAPDFVSKLYALAKRLSSP